MDSVHEERHVRFGPGASLQERQARFLKHRHTYEITVLLTIPDHISACFSWTDTETPTSPCCTIKTCQMTDTAGQLVIIFHADKLKLMKETLVLRRTDHSEMEDLKLTLLARVLGKGQGTPMLKDGIHCIAVEADEESEVSDWQGFN